MIEKAAQTAAQRNDARCAATLIICAYLAAACGVSRDEATSSAKEYVSDSQCAACHASQAESWTGSHHDLALQVATAETVLGDFNDATFEDSGVVTKFFTRDGSYLIETEGPDGEAAEFKVAYTFGVEPLHQHQPPQ